MTSTAVKAQHLSSCIGKSAILKDINFEIKAQSITSILGQSGSGKTTLLKTIAGFQPICEGELFINERLVSKKGFTQTSDKRNVGMVFHDHALFPHLNVIENIETGLKLLKSKTNRINQLVDKLHLSKLLKRYPHELSGGQQQRTALARALVAQPDIILLDEPFANLNQDLQIDVGIELVDILNEQNTTAIMVTHDQDDAMAISDNIIMLMDGKFIQSGSPASLYKHPATRSIASFLSRGSFIKAFYLDKNKAQTPLGVIDITLDKQESVKSGDQIDVWAHPEDVIIDNENGYSVKVIQHSWRPLDLLVKIHTENNEEVLIKADQNSQIENTTQIDVRLKNETTYSAFV